MGVHMFIMDAFLLLCLICHNLIGHEYFEGLWFLVLFRLLIENVSSPLRVLVSRTNSSAQNVRFVHPLPHPTVTVGWNRSKSSRYCSLIQV